MNAQSQVASMELDEDGSVIGVDTRELAWDQQYKLISSTVIPRPIKLPNGEMRTFLEDHDAVILRGWCEKPGAARVGFGECRGFVLPARPL